MYEDREYSEREIAQFFERGVSPQAIENWPWITLPRAVEAVARAGLMDDPADPHAREGLDEALRPRKGFRTKWGCIVVEHDDGEQVLGEESMLYVAGYLDDDPYLLLPHLCSDEDEVGTFLSDVANPALEVVAHKHLRKWLEWLENDTTNKLFETLAFVNPAESSAFIEIGEEFGQWLMAADINGVLARSAAQAHLAQLKREGDVFISSAPRSYLN